MITFIIIAVVVLGGIGAAIYFLQNKDEEENENVDIVSLKSDDWNIQYSPSMPSNPAPYPINGWTFDFPKAGSVHYITTNYKQSFSHKKISITFKIVTTNNPGYVPIGGTDLAQMHLYFQREGDNLSGIGEYAFYRWWSNPDKYMLGAQDNQLVTLSVPLDPARWSSVYGGIGTKSISAFNDAWKYVANIGITFGGTFFGHGVYITKGSAKFILVDFKIS
jgi:hypothetical protein